MRVIEAKGKGIPDLLAKLSAEDTAEFEKKKVEYEAEKERIKKEKEEEKARKAEEAAKKAAEEEAADKESADMESSYSTENRPAMPPGLEDDVSDMEAELEAILADGGSKPTEFLKKEKPNPEEETEVVDEEKDEEETDEKKEEEDKENENKEYEENEEEKQSEKAESPEEEVAKVDYDILDQETFMAKADENAPEIIYTSTVLLLSVKDPLYPEKDLMKLLYRDPVLEQTLVDSEKQSLSSNTSKLYLSSKREEIGDRFVVLKRDYRNNGTEYVHPFDEKVTGKKVSLAPWVDTNISEDSTDDSGGDSTPTTGSTPTAKSLMCTFGPTRYDREGEVIPETLNLLAGVSLVTYFDTFLDVINFFRAHYLFNFTVYELKCLRVLWENDGYDQKAAWVIDFLTEIQERDFQPRNDAVKLKHDPLDYCHMCEVTISNLASKYNTKEKHFGSKQHWERLFLHYWRRGKKVDPVTGREMIELEPLDFCRFCTDADEKLMLKEGLEKTSSVKYEDKVEVASSIVVENENEDGDEKIDDKDATETKDADAKNWQDNNDSNLDAYNSYSETEQQIMIAKAGDNLRLSLHQEFFDVQNDEVPEIIAAARLSIDTRNCETEHRC